MELFTPLQPEGSSSLGLALVVSSSTPLLLLSEALVVQAASGSFCRDFGLDCASIIGTELFALGAGEWDVPQLRSLLTATAAGLAPIDAYEMDLRRAGKPARTLILNAHVLEHLPDQTLQLALAISDVTDARQADRDKDALVREKQILLQELHHRVANSLQIIASVLMQRVRSVNSEETRSHLLDAHHRVMSIATLQRQLASTAVGEVRLDHYLSDLCKSIGASMIPDPNTLSLSVEADGSVMNSDQSVSLGLIVTELVINALKHAFPGEDDAGSITVRFASSPQGWTLVVADNGVGLATDRADTKPGLGTGIVNALAAQLAATVEVTDARPGTMVSVTHASAVTGSSASPATTDAV